MFLLNPHKLTREYPDEKSAEIMRKTVGFFEAKGLAKIKEHDREHLWYSDFLDFIKKERIFATLLTPPEHATDNPGRPLGYLAQLRVQRDPRVLRPVLLVHVAGVDPWARSDLDEPSRRSRKTRRQTA